MYPKTNTGSHYSSKPLCPKMGLPCWLCHLSAYTQPTFCHPYWVTCRSCSHTVAARTRHRKPAQQNTKHLDLGFATHRRSWATFSRSEISTVFTTASAFFFICSIFFSICGDTEGEGQAGSEEGRSSWERE